MKSKERTGVRWPYKSIDDPKYIKDRDDLFKTHGNGWFVFQGRSSYLYEYPKLKRR